MVEGSAMLDVFLHPFASYLPRCLGASYLVRMHAWGGVVRGGELKRRGIGMMARGDGWSSSFWERCFGVILSYLCIMDGTKRGVYGNERGRWDEEVGRGLMIQHL